MMLLSKALIASSLVGLTSVSALEPNPPQWPANVHVFSPENSAETQRIVQEIYSRQGGPNPPNNGHWSSERHALLFMPGRHEVDVPVGYYTEVLGLGERALETSIREVISENGDFDYRVGALNNFWRAAANFRTNPRSGTMTWAVSQATSLRRVLVEGNLDLFQYNYGDAAGYASGGFMGNCEILGTVNAGSQQQWFTRNSEMGGFEGGVWNMVMLGTRGAPLENCGNNQSGIPSLTNTPATPAIAEKPHIFMSDDSTYVLKVPRLRFEPRGHEGIRSVHFTDKDIDFTDVYVATEDDSAALINRKIASGLHVVLTPGTYKLEASIVIDRPDTVVLGIGFPTLVAAGGRPAVVIGDVAGVKLGGVLLEPGAVKTPTLLEVGTENSQFAGDANNPVFLYDVFARVGGPNDVREYQHECDTMVRVFAGNVYLDNLWLWRADHDVSGLVYNGDNPVKHGIQVYGDNVRAYGLMVEHTLEDQTQWFGDNGETFFYQCELPYDVTQASFGDKGHVGYRVGNVTSHTGLGVGVYSFFRDHEVIVDQAIATEGKGVSFKHSLTSFLNGKGSIRTVIDGQGGAVSEGPVRQEWMCQYGN